ncbi:uncharacterized protein LOC127705213 [Mytilus californianus]|uniref:uncharacterized protein LOC127705213 n=1 Tax=Mytilus californianus TaxID=6549 RepID=UPI0022465071|nr:uncharacterized protein LOC127705213 [Mytilus californianus]
MILDFSLHFGLIGFMSLAVSVAGLKCFNCENHVNPACGVYFKAYQFKADQCPGTDVKCALQRQTDKDGWIGIVRVCYQHGSLPGINETNGCKNWTNDMMGYTAYYCFCDTDYCNSSLINSGLVKVVMVLMLMIWIVS